MLDGSAFLDETRDLLGEYEAIRGELEAYDPALRERREIVVLNKVDLLADRSPVEALERTLRARGCQVVRASGADGRGNPRAGPGDGDRRRRGREGSGSRTRRRPGMSAKTTEPDRMEASSARRVVVKVGSGVLTQEGRLRTSVVSGIARQVSGLMDEGREVVLVSSGAIAMGAARLGWGHPGRSIPEKQAAAAVGQIGMVELWRKRFARYDREVAQVLLTRGGLDDRERFLNAATPSRSCWPSAWYRSSTRTTRSPRRRSASATMTISPRPS